jgi:quercetin dioxygenase-like cupin family protein
VPNAWIAADDICGFVDAAAPLDQIAKTPLGSGNIVVGPQTWPGINTQGVTHARLDFAVGGVFPLHTHPRAAETLLVLKGSVYTGFISDDNVLYAATLQQGDVILFPRGLQHFQLNVGNETAITFNTLTSQSPGFLITANQVFQTNITSAVIEKSFGVDAATVKKITASVPDV